MFSEKRLFPVSAIEDPQGFIEQCIKPSLEEVELEIINHGGYIDPSLFMKYDNRKIAYLCYTSGNEELCLNKEPFLASKIE